MQDMWTKSHFQFIEYMVILKTSKIATDES